jgi:ADP-ribosyl-[dinitrogen reductase] hydrolase
MTRSVLSKSVGCLVGLAVGDALGGTNEFKTSNLHQFDPNNLQYVGGGIFDLDPGEWTDDTSMALAIADSIVEKGSFNPADIQQKFWDWKTKGEYCTRLEIFDIGHTTLQAIDYYHDTGMVYAGCTSEFSSGNGGIMRLAPIAIRYQYDTPFNLRKFARLSSSLTHASFECLACAELLANCIFRALQPESTKEYVLSPTKPLEEFDAQTFPYVGYLYNGKLDSFNTPSNGYVTTTLGFALYCFANTNSFAECVAMAASAGGDSDTNAAVAGQIAGAFYGLDEIPKQLVDKLYWKYHIIAFGEALHNLAFNQPVDNHQKYLYN